MAHKEAIRQTARAARRALTDEARSVANSEIAARVVSLPEVADAGAVLGYAALPEEVDPAEALDALRARGVRIALPRVCGPGQLTLHWVGPDEELVHGELGIPEPPQTCLFAIPGDFDAVLVPGVAFDRTCSRLGFGGGFYDSLLSGLPESTVTIGLAFDEQVVDHIPAEAHDAPVGIVVTPTRVLYAGSARAI